MKAGKKRSRSKSPTKSSTRSETQSTKTCCTSIVPSLARCLIVPFSTIICFAVSGNKPIRITKFLTTTTTTAISTSAITWYLNPIRPEEQNCQQEPKPPLSLEDRQFEAYKVWSTKYKLAGQLASGPQFLPRPQAIFADVPRRKPQGDSENQEEQEEEQEFLPRPHAIFADDPRRRPPGNSENEEGQEKAQKFFP